MVAAEETMAQRYATRTGTLGRVVHNMDTAELHRNIATSLKAVRAAARCQVDCRYYLRYYLRVLPHQAP